MTKIKFDMHCHTQEGSIDGRVSIGEYIQILIDKGFGGMLVTDHDSYEGYESWKSNHQSITKDFVVLKGIEYDTCDFGHMIVVLPENVQVDVLEHRGLTLKKLMQVVHHYGGIIGPAHPCGEPFLSFYSTKIRWIKEKIEMLKDFDFMEAFNACEPFESNKRAQELLQKFKKVGFGGSDSHKADCIGKAYTELPYHIKKETDLIDYVKSINETEEEISYGGSRYGKTTKDKLGPINKILVYGFYLYNKLEAFMKLPKRRKAFHKFKEELRG